MTLATKPLPAPDSGGLVRFTIEQYESMIQTGIVPDDGSLELLQGLLIRKDRGVLGETTMGQSPLHSLLVELLTELVPRINSDRRRLRIQLPVRIPPDSLPEPDGSIVRGTPRDYHDRLPGPEDVFCVIEVAHSSLERDTGDKLPIYAAAGIAQYVIVNLRSQVIEVHTEPSAEGRYARKVTVARGETLRLNVGDGEFFELPAEELLP